VIFGVIIRPEKHDGDEDQRQAKLQKTQKQDGQVSRIHLEHRKTCLLAGGFLLLKILTASQLLSLQRPKKRLSYCQDYLFQT
jgi:hypothetical protein